MEVIFVILVVVGIIWFISFLINLIGSSGKALADTLSGKGSFGDNLNAQLRGIEPFEIRINDAVIGEPGKEISVKAVECRGQFPVRSALRVTFVTSLFDATRETLEPVLCSLDSFQETSNTVFQSRVNGPILRPNYGYSKWVRIGTIIPQTLITPCSGMRRLRAYVRLVDATKADTILHGHQQPNDSSILWQRSVDFHHTIKEKGYIEASRDMDKARLCIAKLGIGVALADGHAHDREAQVVRNWIQRQIEPLPDNRKQELKEKLNDAVKSAYSEISDGAFRARDICQQLCDIGQSNMNYEAIELCYDVMAADGKADRRELQLLDRLTMALNLDPERVATLRDKRMIHLDASQQDVESIGNILGIDPDWSPERIKRHLTKEFAKWNNRLNALPQGVQRQNAQKMLDLIAQERRKHG